MSSILGPIHHWLYNKVKVLEGMVSQVLVLAKEQGWEDHLEAELDKEVGKFAFVALEDVIDVDNIHGWLQDLIELEERRFAFVVMRLLKEDEERLADMQGKLFAHGNEIQVAEGSTAVDVMSNIDGLLLNGMPCDAVIQLLVKSDSLVETVTTQKIHEEFWLAQGGTNEIYDTLIESYIKGILNGSEFIFERNGSNRKVFLKSR